MNKYIYPLLFVVFLFGCESNKEIREEISVDELEATGLEEAVEMPNLTLSSQDSLRLKKAWADLDTIKVIPIKCDDAGIVDYTSSTFLIIDDSGSMDGHRMDEARIAAKKFIRSFPDDQNIGLMSFEGGNGKVRVVLGKGRDHRLEIMKGINLLRPVHGTPLGEAICRAVDLLNQQACSQAGFGSRRVIVLTDGDPTGNITAVEAIYYAARSGIPVYVVGFQMKDDNDFRFYSAGYNAANNAAQLAKALKMSIQEPLDVNLPQ